MATRGRKPLPTALKELEGDRGKGRRPLNKDEPTPPQDNVKCPAWLMPEAKKEWKRLAPSLIAMGVLTEHDMEAFAGYCQAYARWREAEEFLSQHGTIFKTPSGYVQQVPQVSIAMQNLKIICQPCPALCQQRRQRSQRRPDGIRPEGRLAGCSVKRKPDG